jgi:hypothetical protein
LGDSTNVDFFKGFQICILATLLFKVFKCGFAAEQSVIEIIPLTATNLVTPKALVQQTSFYTVEWSSDGAVTIIRLGYIFLDIIKNYSLAQKGQNYDPKSFTS